MIFEFHELGQGQIGGMRSRKNGRNGVMTKLWELQILGTWSGLILRRYLYVKIKVELKNSKGSSYHQLNMYFGRLGRI